MGLHLHILGCHSATPKTNAAPSAQLLEMDGHMFLIDCGEGTQVALRRNKIKFARIKQIFISHLHGDHYFGLFGLIATFNLLGRTEPLDIFGPKGLKDIVLMSLKLGGSWTKFPLRFHELSQSQSDLIYEDQNVSVRTLPLDHRVYTNGFLFEQKPRLRPLNAQAAHELRVPSAYFNKAKQGDWVQDERGNPIDFKAITFDPPPSISYAYCSDTAYYPPLADLIQGVTLLYHESTFLSQHEELCGPTKHSTARQAAEIALKAQAKFLLLGHYSGRYKSLEDFKIEASAVFPQVTLARENTAFSLAHGGASELTEI
jgi:ribonuclease Z